MEWKAKIIHVSEIDSAGMMQVIFDVFCDEERKFESICLNTRPDSIEVNIKYKLLDFKQLFKTAEKIIIGSEILI